MARKVSAGIAGGAAVAGLQAFTTTLTSASNLDITVEPAGTGRFLINGNAQLLAQGDLRFADADSSNWVAFQAPTTIAANYTLTLPSTDGTNNQVLTTNGSGTLSWTNKSVAVSDDALDSNVNYPIFSSATSGNLETVKVTTTRLDFQPSTGRFRLLGNVASTTTATGTLVVTGGVGIGGQMTAASIVETSSITIKENVMPIENALGLILNLQGVTYDRIDNKEHEAGLIAEWVNEIMPSLVTKDNTGNVVGIKYTKLTAYLIEAIKSLKTEIDNLKKN
jgi:hypothetical protein